MTSQRSWSLTRSFRNRSASGGAIFLQDNKTCCKTVTCREGDMVQDIIKRVCREMDIPPMARVFFALCSREKGIPISPLSPYRRLSRQEGRKKYQLRVFVNVENSNYLQHISPAAHSYYYEQLRHDFLADNLQPRATINSAVWMTAIEMAKEAKAKGINFDELQGRISEFMPEFLYKRYKKENKVEEKIKETFDRFHELDVDDSHYVSKFLEVYEKDKMCGRHLFPLKQSRMLNFRGTPQLVVISWKEGVYKRAIGDQEDKREPICSFSDISELKIDISLTQLTIKKMDDSDTTLYFMEQKHLVAFAVIAQAYWTLNVDGSNFVLRGDIAPPEECLKIDKSERHSLCHGPIAQASVEHVLRKLGIVEGHFMVRESRTMDNAYTLSVCHDGKVMHYRIIRHGDGMYSFRDPDKGSGRQLEADGLEREYERFPTLHDLVKSYHQRADGLPTLLRTNITPNVSGKIPLLPSRNQSSGTLTPSSSASMTIGEHRPRSSSSDDHSYMESTMSPPSTAPQTPSEVNPPPQLAPPTTATESSPPTSKPTPPPEPQNEYIRELYEAGVPFIRYKDLIITGKLGEGHFSKVYRAKMFDSDNKEIAVAVKIPEVDYDNSTNAEAAKKDLTREMFTMHSFNHHNIVKLIRVSETQHYLDYIGMLPVMIMEFIEGGSLRGYLDNKRKNITSEFMDKSKTIFLNIGQQIAEGMKYLEERKVVHRDLAARNVLMVNESNVKISDFGLSRKKIEDKEYYKAKQTGTLPIFWYAPECLLTLRFTSQGDVWSYGTTLWEIFTFGENPSNYLHRLVLGNPNPYRALVDYYRARNRLPKGNCNMTIFKIISDCWSFDEASRPSFAKLAMDLEELLQKIKGHSAEAKQLPQENGHPPMSRTAANGSATITQNGAAAGTQPLS